MERSVQFHYICLNPSPNLIKRNACEEYAADTSDQHLRIARGLQFQSTSLGEQFEMLVVILLKILSVVHCQIKIDIYLTGENETASVNAYGEIRHLITREEQESFYLTNQQIYDDIFYIHSPPEYISVQNHAQYGYRDIYTTLQPVQASVVSLKHVPITLMKRQFKNIGDKLATNSMTIKGNRVERLIIDWSAEKMLSVNREIEINLENKTINTASWNNNETIYRDRTLRSLSDVTFSLQPGQSATISVHASKIQLRVRVDYVATLDGDLFFRQVYALFPDRVEMIDVNEYLKNMVGRPGRVTATQNITVEFYYGGLVFVKDNATGNFLIDPIPLE